MSNSTKITLFFDAAGRGDLEEIKRLVEEDNISVNFQNRNDETTIAHIAAEKGYLPVVEYVLEKDPSITTINDLFGNTVLSLAVRNGRLKMVKHLVECYGADINKPIKSLYTEPNAAQIAAGWGQLKVLKYFLEEKNADVYAMNGFGEPLTFSAVRKNHHKVVKYLLEERNVNFTMTDTNGDNILYMTVKARDLPMMKYLLDEKKINLDVNYKNKHGRSVLHLTAFYNIVDMLSYLVEQKGAAVNIVDNKGQTPLHRAVFHRNRPSCEYLLTHGADIGWMDRDGKTPMNETNDEELIEFLKNVSSSHKRDRRSMPFFVSSIIQESMPIKKAVYPMNYEYLEGNARNSRDVNSPAFLLNFLELATSFIQKFSAHRVNICRAFLSPQEIIKKRMDPIAVDVAQNHHF